MKRLFTVLLLVFINIQSFAQNDRKAEMEQFIDSLIRLMTIEEKAGQMNQYNGFWDITGPVPKDGNAKLKYEHLEKGWVGSMINIKGAEHVRKMQ